MTEVATPPPQPKKPVKKWLVGVLVLLVLIGLIPLVLLIAWPVYGIVAKRAYEAHVVELEGKGESLEIADHVPAAVENPDDNFAEEPIIREIIRTAREAPVDDLETAAFLERYDIKNLPGYEWGGRERRVRLVEQAPLNENFPELTEREAAEMILEHCSEIEELDALVRAARRPAANFDLDYEALFFMRLDDVTVLRDLVKLLILRGRSAMLVGEMDQALDDMETLMQVSEKFLAEPALIFLLVGIDWRERSADLASEGLQKRLWTESHLARIEQFIPNSENGARFFRSMRMERAIVVNRLLNLRRMSERKDSDYYEQVKWLGMTPVGYQYDNARMASELIQKYKLERSLLNLSDPLDKETSLEAQLFHLRRNPFIRARYALATMILPAYNTIGQRFLRCEILMEQAKLAVALERFRIATGSYPENLEALNTTIPLDPFAEKPMAYRKEGKSYVLYSIGSNGIDEGGLLKHHRDYGDYVWRLDLPDDFDRDDYSSRD
ncbi:MAG: hypothetical protein P1U86_17625 [Verrucomicrobiales bacterium]|nr:hypothetical protein [Verrucomicrobiales bacterium]